MSLTNLFKGDKVVWMVFFFLSVISVVEVYSASSSLTFKGVSYWIPIMRHVSFWLIGVFFMIVVMNMKCGHFKIATPFLIVASFVMLILVFFVGKSENDASRWLPILGFTFQPSEIAKGTMVLATAQILSLTQTENGAEKHAFYWIGAVCLPMLALIGVENMSTAILVAATLFMMMVVGRIPARQLGALMGVSTILVAFIIAIVFAVGDTSKAEEKTPKTEVVQTRLGEVTKAEKKGKKSDPFHRASLWKKRIVKFFDSRKIPADSVDLRGTDSQPNFSQIAIAGSNVVGLGPGNSVERDFLQQAYSDYIYAIIIEEMGVEGAIFVALLYIIILFRAGRIANRCENSFPAFLVMGLALMLVTQALFNMCVAVGLAPVTGQPLPLISRGGSSTVINCVYIGAILCVSRTAKKKKDDRGDVKPEMVRVAKN